MTDFGVIQQILDLARWAPSGDNTQPWRFELIDESHIVVHGFDTREHCVYDLDGRPSQISVGALLETIAIAATAHGLRTSAQRRPDAAETQPTFDICFSQCPNVEPDALIASITKRSVQRRPMHIRSLTMGERAALERAVGTGYRVAWLEGLANRTRAAYLMFRYAKLRLTMPEAYSVHRDIIEWSARYSEDRVPDQALGIDPMTVRLMRFAMQSWPRVKFFNRYLAGTWVPRIQMDLVPGMACAAHFLIVARKAPVAIDDYIGAGRFMQRFWLTATQLGLVVQPELTPLIFSRYVRNGTTFTKEAELQELAATLATQLSGLVGQETAAAGVFMGRIGAGPAARSRSTRRSVAALILSK